MIEEGTFKVLGGNHIIYVFLCKSKSNVGNKLLPQELENKVKGILGWYQAKMQVPGQQMFRMQTEPGLFGGSPSKEVYDKWLSDFMACLKTLDQRLVENPNLCGGRITIGDIIVFNELSLFLELNGLTVKSPEFQGMPNLTKWFEK